VQILGLDRRQVSLFCTREGTRACIYMHATIDHRMFILQLWPWSRFITLIFDISKIQLTRVVKTLRTIDTIYLIFKYVDWLTNGVTQCDSLHLQMHVRSLTYKINIWYNNYTYSKEGNLRRRIVAVLIAVMVSTSTAAARNNTVELLERHCQLLGESLEARILVILRTENTQSGLLWLMSCLHLVIQLYIPY